MNVNHKQEYAKVCPGCNKEKRLKRFKRDIHGKVQADNVRRRSRCKRCVKKYYKEYCTRKADEARIRSRDWYHKYGGNERKREQYIQKKQLLKKQKKADKENADTESETNDEEIII